VGIEAAILQLAKPARRALVIARAGLAVRVRLASAWRAVMSVSHAVRVPVPQGCGVRAISV